MCSILAALLTRWSGGSIPKSLLVPIVSALRHVWNMGYYALPSAFISTIRSRCGFSLLLSGQCNVIYKTARAVWHLYTFTLWCCDGPRHFFFLRFLRGPVFELQIMVWAHAAWKRERNWQGFEKLWCQALGEIVNEKNDVKNQTMTLIVSIFATQINV